MAEDHETEQRILDAAHAVFMRRGTAGARTQEIADEAGVNKALLHYYFRSKDRLAEAVFQRAAAELLPPVLATLASDEALEEKVRRVIRLELEILSRNPYLPAYVISEAHHHPERIKRMVANATGGPSEGFARHALGKLQEQIDAAVAAGEMRRVAADQFAVNLLGACLFPFAARPMLCAGLGWKQEDFEQFIERRKISLPDFFLAALRP
jgi:TetR/AcrR family transcriptional regulator